MSFRQHTAHALRCAISLFFDRHHARWQRLTAGALAMAAGILTCQHAPEFIGHFGADAIGFVIHGMGLAPWIETVAALVTEE